LPTWGHGPGKKKILAPEREEADIFRRTNRHRNQLESNEEISKDIVKDMAASGILYRSEELPDIKMLVAASI